MKYGSCSRNCNPLNELTICATVLTDTSSWEGVSECGEPGDLPKCD